MTVTPARRDVNINLFSFKKGVTHDREAEEHTPFAVPHDWLLQSLANMANDGFEVGITVQVSGFLVSGVLAGGKAYFEGFAEEFSSRLNDPESPEFVRGYFTNYGDIYKKEDGAPPSHRNTYISRTLASSILPATQPLETEGFGGAAAFQKSQVSR